MKLTEEGRQWAGEERRRKGRMKGQGRREGVKEMNRGGGMGMRKWEVGGKGQAKTHGVRTKKGRGVVRRREERRRKGAQVTANRLVAAMENRRVPNILGSQS